MLKKYSLKNSNFIQKCIVLNNEDAIIEMDEFLQYQNERLLLNAGEDRNFYGYIIICNLDESRKINFKDVKDTLKLFEGDILFRKENGNLNILPENIFLINYKFEN